DRKTLPTAGLYLRDTLGDLPDLFLQKPLLAFLADGDFLKLAVTHDDGIVVASGDSGTKFFAIVLLKIFSRCHQDVSGWVEPQELRSPLLGQVVRHHKERFLTKRSEELSSELQSRFDLVCRFLL